MSLIENYNNLTGSASSSNDANSSLFNKMAQNVRSANQLVRGGLFEAIFQYQPDAPRTFNRGRVGGFSGNFVPFEVLTVDQFGISQISDSTTFRIPVGIRFVQIHAFFHWLASEDWTLQVWRGRIDNANDEIDYELVAQSQTGDNSGNNRSNSEFLDCPVFDVQSGDFFHCMMEIDGSGSLNLDQQVPALPFSGSLVTYQPTDPAGFFQMRLFR